MVADTVPRAHGGRLDGNPLPVDLAVSAESLGVTVLRARTIDELRARLEEAKATTRGSCWYTSTTTRWSRSPVSVSWWDVPVAEVAAFDSTQRARITYEQHKADQRPHLAGPRPAPTTTERVT